MENIRPIDANALALKIGEYMVGFPKRSERMFTCMHILSMLGDENQTPTLSGFARGTNVPSIGEPLTLEQLRKKIDKPVYVQNIDGKFRDSWQILKDVNDEEIVFYGKGLCGYRPTKELGKTYNLYPYPPARIDREKWEPCHVCGKWNILLYRGFRTAEEAMDLSGKSHPHTTGGAWFCPRCGRPLTPEAWEELERRLMTLPEPPKEG